MSLKNFILSYSGCSEVGCMGPPPQWYLLGLPINQYPSMIITSLVITIIFSIIFFTVKRNNLNFKRIAKISGIAFIISLVLVWIFLLWKQSQIIY